MKLHRVGGVPQVVVAVVAAIFALVVVGCGSTPTACTPQIMPDLQVACGQGKPVDTQAAIDITAIRGDKPVANDYATAVLRVAQATIKNGGRLTVVAFDRTAARRKVLFDAQVPTLAQEAEDERGGDEDAVTGGLQEALGTLRSLKAENGTGSDILGAAEQLSEMARTPGAPLVGLVLTDGKVQVGDFNLVAAVKRDPQAAVRLLIKQVPAGSKAFDALAVVGIGLTGTKEKDEDPAITNGLVAGWQELCNHTARVGWARARVL